MIPIASDYRSVSYHNVLELITTLALIAAADRNDQYVRILARCETILTLTDADYAANAAAALAARISVNKSAAAADIVRQYVASAYINTASISAVQSAYTINRSLLFSALAETADQRTAAIRAAIRPWSAAAATMVAADVAFARDVYYIADQLRAADTGISALISELHYISKLF